MIYSESEIDQEILQITQKNDIPVKYSMREFPYNELSDKEFEVLLYKIMKYNGANFMLFDSCVLMSGSGDKGRDVSLSYKSKIVGLVQCKRYKNILDKASVAKEILKFILHAIQDSERYDFSNFKYILAVSTGVSPEASELIQNFNIKLTKEKDYPKWLTDLLKEYKSLKIDINTRKKQIEKIIASIGITILLPTDISDLLKDNIKLIKTFFYIESVIDVQTFEEIVKDSKLDLNQFLLTYKEGAINNYSRVNFFGFSLSKKPREVPLKELFVHPEFQLFRPKRDKLNSFYSYEQALGRVQRSHEIINENNSNKSIIIGSVGSGKTSFMNKLFENSIMEILNDQSKGIMFDFNNIYQETLPVAIDFSKIISVNKNLVLLGRAGAGKSSLAKYAICMILEKDQVVFKDLNVFKNIPFRIELHNYNKAKSTRGFGIIEYISHILSSEFQMTFVSKHGLENLFKNYETIIFFDGLDEVIDVNERINVRNDIENFTRNFKKVKSIVTSRFESYREVNFKDQEFEAYEVLDFNNNQIQRFVGKWYELVEDDHNLREAEVSSCLIELEKIEDELKRNPLLLTLILLLYRNEQELPTSKLDVYEGCTNTLVETRDTKEKGLVFGLKISNKISTLAALAFWQYNQMNKKGKPVVTSQEAQVFLKKYLLNKQEFEEEYDANLAAEQLLEYANLRSIYVENQFTHKTFLEYFTAYHIFSNFHSKGDFKKRDKIITEHIGNSTWKIILELLICKIDKDQGDFEVIDNIIQSLLRTETNKEQTLIFFLGILKYLKNISPRMKAQLISNSISFCIENLFTDSKTSAKTVNSYLMGLCNEEKFAELVKIHTDSYWNTKGTEMWRNLAVYVLENKIPSKFLESLVNNPIEIERLESDPYLFILLHFSKLNTEEGTLEVLNKFIKIFTLDAITHHYPFSLGNKLFGEEDAFNWIKFVLFTKPDYIDFKNAYFSLKRMGVRFNHISVTIDKDSAECLLTKDTLLSLYDLNVNNEIELILKKALKRYFNVSLRQKVEIPFSQKQKNPNRRFPIPR